LLDKIKELEGKIKQLEAENKRLKELTPQELINEAESYKVTRLKIQLEKSNSQIEVKK
jgi:cell shape-determining protein MreC